MSKKIKNNQSLLYGVILILITIVGYLSFVLFKNNQLSSSIREYKCIKPSKVCALVEYKYTDNLEAQVSLLPGEYYFKDEKLELFKEYLSDWENKKKDRKTYDDDLVIDNFAYQLGRADGKIYILLNDEDGFEVNKITINLSDKSKDISNGIISRSRTVNQNGTVYSRYYAIKKKIEIDNFKRIDKISIRWNGSITNNLPE